MVAAKNRKEAPGVGKRSALDVLDPRAKFAKRNVVFGFAGYCASVAADAFAVIDYKTVSHI